MEEKDFDYKFCCILCGRSECFNQLGTLNIQSFVYITLFLPFQIILVQGCPRFSSDSKDFPRFYKYFVLIAALCMFLESLSLMFTLCKKTLQIHGINWMLHSFAYVLSFGSIVWTFYQIDNTNMYHIDLCIECMMPKNCSIPDLQDYPFSNDLNNTF